MSSKIYTAALQGLDCEIVEVETDYKRGESYFSIVGLADKSIQEAKDRIPSALKNSEAEFVPMRIIINLAPAELIKRGPSYDFPLAISYLLETGQIDFESNQKIFIGELALDGRLRPVSGILPIVDAIKRKGYKEIYLPFENAKEAALVKDIEIYAVKNLKQIIDHFNLIEKIEPFQEDVDTLKTIEENYVFNLSQVKGQEHAKRALEIAAAGGHNILLSGVPGSGKTMLSRCLPSILPKMSVEESLEVTRIYSVCGLTSKKDPLIKVRPFRTPHHTSSQVALVGGGGKIRPGEISLAHRGVLFLDEFPEFSALSLEALRQPLEDRVVTISRASGTLTFPANFILAAAMNPCKCGYLGDPVKECTCTSIEISRYSKRLSGPILDRIDLLVNVPKVKNEKLFDNSKNKSSAEFRETIQKARDIQLARYKDALLFCNSEMNHSQIQKYININKKTEDLLKRAMEKLNLSARSYFRLLKVSRTIADLEASEKIEDYHVKEALSFRVDVGG